MFNLTGKVALVTGASSGMGRASALALAGQGTSVAIAARRVEKLEELKKEIEAKGGKALVVAMDVTKKETIQAAVDETVKTFGKLDILLNDAGTLSYAAFVDLTEEQWDKVLTTNLKGYFLVGQMAARQMVKQKSGVIVNIASIASGGIGCGFPMLAHYASSKGGVIALTETMAMELGPMGIRVCAIAPGAIQTEMNPTDDVSAYINRLAVKRVGKPEEIAAGVVYLVSDEAGYTTGSTLYIDGGWTAS